MFPPQQPQQRTQDEAFKKMLPDNFYFNHYQLAEIYPDWTPEEWRQYLKLNERFIYNEMAAITDANARQALQKLAEGKLSAQDNTAIRQILDRSEQINSVNQDARTFVMFQFDPTDSLQLTSGRQKQGTVISLNIQNVNKFYGLTERDPAVAMESRVTRGIVHRNANGTLHFPDLKHEWVTPLDEAYLRMFNPQNERITELPSFEDDSDLEDTQ